MKKVLVFRTDLLPRSETFIKEQILALTQWTPVLAGYRRVRNGLDLAGIDVRVFPGLNKGRFGRWWLRLSQWMGVAHAPTVRALRETEATLVHVHFGTDAVRIWPSVRKLGLPMLATLHGYDINIYREWWEAGNGGPLMRTYPRQLLRMAKNPAVKFIAVSQAIKDRAIEYGIPSEKITVCYIGVDTTRFKPGGLPLDRRRKEILFIGRMVEKKAPLLMIRAFAEVLKSVTHAELSMIGDGPLLSDAKALSTELKIPVKFFGARTSDEVLARFREARVLCLPSVTANNGDAEGFGLVILEAQACGVPVVSSARGGSVEGLVEGTTGFHFHERDLEALSEKIKFLIADDNGLLQISSNAVDFVRQTFDIHHHTNILEQIYCNRILDTGKCELKHP